MIRPEVEMGDQRAEMMFPISKDISRPELRRRLDGARSVEFPSESPQCL